MTTTDVYGFVETASGKFFHIFTNLTDAAAAGEVKIVDQGFGNAQSVKDALRGETITRCAVAVCDGSILTQFGIKKGGAYIFHSYGGERLASGPQATNLDIWGLSIPVDDTTLFYAVTDE